MNQREAIRSSLIACFGAEMAWDDVAIRAIVNDSKLGNVGSNADLLFADRLAGDDDIAWPKMVESEVEMGERRAAWLKVIGYVQPIKEEAPSEPGAE